MKFIRIYQEYITDRIKQDMYIYYVNIILFKDTLVCHLFTIVLYIDYLQNDRINDARKLSIVSFQRCNHIETFHIIWQPYKNQ